MADGAVTRVSSVVGVDVTCWIVFGNSVDSGHAVGSGDVTASAHFIFPAYVWVQLPGEATKLAIRRKSEAFFIGFGNIHYLL